MQTGRIIVLNVKGGCGKSTIATNLAAAYAARGLRVALIDYDPQHSSLAWLKARPSTLPSIHGLAAHEPHGLPFSNTWQMRVPRDVQRVIMDTPAGLRPADLAGRIMANDRLLIPIQPSAIDIRATADFIRDLLLVGKINLQRHRLAIIANRTKEKRPSFSALQRFLDSLRISVLAYLKDSQIYVAAAEEGCSVCELSSNTAQSESAKWSEILKWIDEGLPTAEPVRTSAASPVGARLSTATAVQAVMGIGKPAAMDMTTAAKEQVPSFLRKNAPTWH